MSISISKCAKPGLPPGNQIKLIKWDWDQTRLNFRFQTLSLRPSCSPWPMPSFLHCDELQLNQHMFQSFAVHEAIFLFSGPICNPNTLLVCSKLKCLRRRHQFALWNALDMWHVGQSVNMFHQSHHIPQFLPFRIQCQKKNGRTHHDCHDSRPTTADSADLQSFVHGVRPGKGAWRAWWAFSLISIFLDETLKLFGKFGDLLQNLFLCALVYLGYTPRNERSITVGRRPKTSI